MILKDKKGNELCTGTRQECLRFANSHGLTVRDYNLFHETGDNIPPISTTSPTESKSTGFFKKIFSRTK